MDTSSSAQSVWEQLKAVADSSEHESLTEVSRIISFRPYETYGPHRHRRIEINYVKKGSCILQLTNESASFRRNEIMIIASDTEHRFEAGPEGTTLMQLEFHPDLFVLPDSTVPTFFLGESGLLRIVHNVRIGQAVQRIVNELNQREKHYRPLVLLYYTELSVLLRRYMEQTYWPLCSDPAMKAAIAFIRTRFADPIAIADVAVRAGIGSRYLRKLFDRYLNLSPLEYLIQVRIDRAIELLRNTDLSVKEIAFACGFHSPQYFSRVFRRRIGRSPKSFTR